MEDSFSACFGSIDDILAGRIVWQAWRGVQCCVSVRARSLGLKRSMESGMGSTAQVCHCLVEDNVVCV